MDNSNRLSERAKKDSKICEIKVENIEKKDLGKWRSNLFYIYLTYVIYVTCYNLETYPGVLSTAKSVAGHTKTSKWRKQRMRLMSYQVTWDDVSTKSSVIFFILFGIWAILASCKSVRPFFGDGMKKCEKRFV